MLEQKRLDWACTRGESLWLHRDQVKTNKKKTQSSQLWDMIDSCLLWFNPEPRTSHLCIISCVFCLFCITAAALWRGVQAVSPVPSVPDRVQALVGSCVVIPCSFTPPAPHPLWGRKERVDVRLRFRGGGHLFPLRSTAFNSEDRDQVSRDFQGRTSLFGRIADGDCSVKIERISQDDSRVFEIALKKSDDLLWGKPRRLSLDVVGEWGSPYTASLISYTGVCLLMFNNQIMSVQHLGCGNIITIQ